MKVFEPYKDYGIDYWYFAPIIEGIKILVRSDGTVLEGKKEIKPNKDIKRLIKLMRRMRLYWVEGVFSVNGMTLDDIKENYKAGKKLPFVAYDCDGEGIEHLEHKKVALEYIYSNSEINIISFPVMLSEREYIESQFGYLKEGNHKLIYLINPETNERYIYNLDEWK